MSATQFGLTILYIAVAVIFYAAGWWQGRTVERERWEERGAAQDQLVQRVQPGEEPVVPVRRQPIRAQELTTTPDVIPGHDQDFRIRTLADSAQY